MKEKFDKTTSTMKDQLNTLDDNINEKKIAKQQAKYEEQKKKNADLKKMTKLMIGALGFFVIFAGVMSFFEDDGEPTNPSEPVVISTTTEKEDTNDISKEENKDKPKDKIGTEGNPITIDNCPEFAQILACKDSNDISYSEFAEKHYGEYVEFVANIQYISSEYKYGKYWGNVLLCGGEFPGSNAVPTGPYFRDLDAKEEAFDDANIGPHESLHPYGTTVKVKAILRLYDEEKEIYEIDLLYLTNIKSNPENK